MQMVCHPLLRRLARTEGMNAESQDLVAKWKFTLRWTTWKYAKVDHLHMYIYIDINAHTYTFLRIYLYEHEYEHIHVHMYIYICKYINK